MSRKTLPYLLLLLLVAVWIAAMALGTGPVDRAVLSTLYSADQPALRMTAGAVTLVGEWQTMLLLVGAASLWLLYRRRLRDALLFAAATLSGRLMILLQKQAVGRLRPDAEEHLVVVRSLSFPSAHTANSMIVFLALALIAAPDRVRREAVVAALAGTFLIGISRPMLGVHWPSDVIGGWAFGALWVLIFIRAARLRD